VPPNLEGVALEALEKYAAAEKAAGFDPRAGWAGAR
jgi:molecular chaperone DnaJ